MVFAWGAYHQPLLKSGFNMKFRFSILGILWLITLIAMIVAVIIARQEQLEHQQLVLDQKLIVAENDAKAFVLEFLAAHDPDNEAHSNTIQNLKFFLQHCDGNLHSEVRLSRENLANSYPPELWYEIVDVTPGNDEDEVEALLFHYNSFDSPGGNAVAILLFREKRFLSCHSQSSGTRMGQANLELSCADNNGDGNLEFDIKEAGAAIYRYSLKGDELVRTDLIVVKPEIFHDKESQKKFEESGKHLVN